MSGCNGDSVSVKERIGSKDEIDINEINVTKDAKVRKTVVRAGSGERPSLHANCVGESAIVILSDFKTHSFSLHVWLKHIPVLSSLQFPARGFCKLFHAIFDHAPWGITDWLASGTSSLV